MAECGICLDVLCSPVSIPCGHVHCERCLRGHINSGADALKSACPTCRKSFHIATPDFSFVPPKYHDFILPSVRKIYMDIPSVAAMSAEIEALTQRLEGFVKENEQLRRRCADYKYMIDDMVSEKRAVALQEEETRREVAELRRKYEFLKRRYHEAQSRSNDHLCDATPSQGLSRNKSYQSLEIHRGVLPKVEELPVSLHDSNSRPKRALPKSRLSNGMRRKDEQSSQHIKRQRTHRYSDVGSGDQSLEADFKYEDEDDD